MHTYVGLQWLPSEEEEEGAAATVATVATAAAAATTTSTATTTTYCNNNEDLRRRRPYSAGGAWGVALPKHAPLAPQRGWLGAYGGIWQSTKKEEWSRSSSGGVRFVQLVIVP